jgi:predicted transcriptional regulator
VKDFWYASIYVGIFNENIGLVVNLELVVESVFSWWFENLV